jgi:hypothetical protein
LGHRDWLSSHYPVEVRQTNFINGDIPMASLLWVLVAIFVIAWLLGLGGVFHMAVALIWLFLIVAVIIAVISLLSGGIFSSRS